MLCCVVGYTKRIVAALTFRNDKGEFTGSFHSSALATTVSCLHFLSFVFWLNTFIDATHLYLHFLMHKSWLKFVHGDEVYEVWKKWNAKLFAFNVFHFTAFIVCFGHPVTKIVTAGFSWKEYKNYMKELDLIYRLWEVCKCWTHARYWQFTLLKIHGFGKIKLNS